VVSTCRLESIPAASGEQVKREFARTPAARPWCLKLIRNLAIPEPVSVWLTGKQELRPPAIIRAMTRISNGLFAGCVNLSGKRSVTAGCGYCTAAGGSCSKLWDRIKRGHV